MTNLKKRLIIVMDWSCTCKKNKETIDHLLLHCKEARDLRNSIFNLLGIKWAMPQWVVELLTCWRNQFGRHCNRSLEYDSVMLNVVYLTRMQCLKL